MAIALFNKEYIICVGDSYISGGMFRIGEEHYARTVKFQSKAKVFQSKKKAEKVAKKLSEKCANISGNFQVIENRW